MQQFFSTSRQDYLLRISLSSVCTQSVDWQLKATDIFERYDNCEEILLILSLMICYLMLFQLIYVSSTLVLSYLGGIVLHVLLELPLSVIQKQVIQRKSIGEC